MLTISIIIVFMKLSLTYAIIGGRPSPRRFTVRLSLDNEKTWETGTFISKTTFLTIYPQPGHKDSFGNIIRIRKIIFQPHYQYDNILDASREFQTGKYFDSVVIIIQLFGEPSFLKYMEYKSKNIVYDGPPEHGSIYRYCAVEVTGQTGEKELIATHGDVKFIAVTEYGYLLFLAVDFVPEKVDEGGAIVDKETDDVFGIIFSVNVGKLIYVQSTYSLEPVNI